uniref:ATP-dependent DNA helicase n=1 Tax=Ditylenchus dipsaci TaxID=166011 RepID=A0A915E1L3_9BILA
MFRVESLNPYPVCWPTKVERKKSSDSWPDIPAVSPNDLESTCGCEANECECFKISQICGYDSWAWFLFYEEIPQSEPNSLSIYKPLERDFTAKVQQPTSKVFSLKTSGNQKKQAPVQHDHTIDYTKVEREKLPQRNSDIFNWPWYEFCHPAQKVRKQRRLKRMTVRQELKTTDKISPVTKKALKPTLKKVTIGNQADNWLWIEEQIKLKNDIHFYFRCGCHEYNVVENDHKMDVNSYYISVNDFLAMKKTHRHTDYGNTIRNELLRHFECYEAENNFTSVLTAEKIANLLRRLEHRMRKMDGKTRKAFRLKQICLGPKSTTQRPSPPLTANSDSKNVKLSSKRSQRPASPVLHKIKRGRPKKTRSILLTDGNILTVSKRGRLSKIAQMVSILTIPKNQKANLTKNELESIRSICVFSQLDFKCLKLKSQPMTANCLYTILCFLSAKTSRKVAIVDPNFSCMHYADDLTVEQKENISAADMFFGFSDPEVLLIPIACYNQDSVLSDEVGHWVLAIFHVSNRSVYYYDSNHIALQDRSHVSSQYRNISAKEDLIIQHSYLYYNRQLDNYSCGHFVALYADLFLNYDKEKMYVQNFDISRQIDRVNSIVLAVAEGEHAAYSPIPGSHCVKQWPINHTVRPPPPVDEWRKKILDMLNKLKKKTNRSKPTPAFHLDVDGELFSCQCPHCTAFVMLYEDKKLRLGRFTKCCALGKVKLLEEWNLRQMVPEEFEHLLTLSHCEYSLKALKDFLKFSLNKTPLTGFRAPVQVNGCSAYLLSGLLPPKDKNGNPAVERFGQLYYVEPEDVMQKRLEGQTNLQGTSWINVKLLDELHRMIKACNPFAKLYYDAYETYQRRLKEYRENYKEGMVAPKLQMVILTNREVTDQMKKDILGGEPAPHPHRTEYPDVPAVGMIYENADGNPPDIKGVMTENRDGETKMLHYSNPQVDPICFPLICPYGQQGYRCGIKLDGTVNTTERVFEAKNVIKCSESKKFIGQAEQTFDKKQADQFFWKNLQKDYKKADCISCYTTESPVDIPLEHFLRMANEDEPSVSVAHKGWYDMETIECYAQLIVREYSNCNYIPMHVVNVLLSLHGDSMDKWPAGVLPDWNPAQFSRIFMIANIPHEGDDFIDPKLGQNHWSAILADLSMRTIEIYVFDGEILCKMSGIHNLNMHPSEWKMSIDYSAQQQINGSDCGPFSLMQTVHFVTNAVIPFQCYNIAAARISMAKHLISQKIRNEFEHNIEQKNEAVKVPEPQRFTAKKTVQPVQIPLRSHVTSKPDQPPQREEIPLRPNVSEKETVQTTELVSERPRYTAKKTVQPLNIPVRPTAKPVEQPQAEKMPVLPIVSQKETAQPTQSVFNNNIDDDVVEDSEQELSEYADSEENNSLDDSFEFPNETTIIRDHCLLDDHMINVLTSCDHEGLGASELWSLGCSSAWSNIDSSANSISYKWIDRVHGFARRSITANIKSYKNYSEEEDWKYAVIFVRPFLGHWTVALAEKDSNEIFYYESIPERREYPLSKAVENRIKKAVKDLSSNAVNIDQLSIVIMTGNQINDQLDSVNCGFFAALNVEGFLNNSEHTTKLQNFDILQERQRLIRHLRELQRSDYGEYIFVQLMVPSEIRTQIYVSQRRYMRFMLMRRQKQGYHHIHGKGKLTQVAYTESRQSHAWYTTVVDGHISAEIPDLPTFTKEEFAKLTKLQQTYVEEQVRLHALVTRHNIHVCSESAMCLVNGRCQKDFPNPLHSSRLLQVKEIVNTKTIIEIRLLDNRYPSYSRRPPMPTKEVVSTDLGTAMTDFGKVEQKNEDTFDPSSSLNNVADEELEPITTIYNHHNQWEDAIPLDEDQSAYGNTYEKKLNNGTSVMTHINVEDCFGQKCVNYVLKYITKGTASTTLYRSEQGTLGLSERSKQKRLARICAVNAKDVNLTAIRNLLLFVRGPTGFTDLCRVNPELPDQVAVGMPACKSFVESCFLRGISEDINLWLQTLNDAADEYGNPRRFRHFFAMTLFHSKPSRTQDIFNIMLDKLMLPANNKDPESAEAKFARRQKVLNYLEYIFRQMNSSCEEMGLESPLNYDPGVIEEELNKETWLAHVADCPDAPKLPTWMWYADRNLKKFNDEQKEAFDQIKSAIESDSVTNETMCRKTFLYNTVIAWCKAKGIKVSSTATTGIAATLLINGGTLHSALRIGEDVDENAQPNINFESEYAKKLRDTRLFIIDEVSMLNKHNLEYLDRLLKSVSVKPHSDFHFAGKVVVLGGDWKQLMPVVQGGDVLDQYNATIKKICEDEFAKKVYDLGMGRNYIEGTPYVRAHPDCLVRSVGAMLERIYPDAVLADPTNNTRAFAENAILCPRNSNVFALNQTIIEMLPDQVDIFAINAADKLIEHVHTLTPTGFPPHRLILKVGTPVMLIRNLDISNGLVNGTRMQVLKLGRNLLTCQILSGSLKVKSAVFSEYGSIMENVQKKPALYGAACNSLKSLKRVGICLEHQQVFAHGQLYTAQSRATTQAGLTILNAPLERSDGTVVYDHLLNIVYRPVLDKEPVSSLAATCGEMSPERVRNKQDRNARIPRIPSYQKELISSPAHAEKVTHMTTNQMMDSSGRIGD